ncbi:MAG: transglycosylase SLT domain-containing protein [Gloeomargarita sp. SKYBB_i_bin120]|nr:transglycosylase SLT domain-containing protein [Gloeomargarita sp. SKYB120]MDW8178024.1 transglycosylase SLT domain-containing protein [Gloeomargarita sp. SKYBB_i_bin120]
MTRRWWRWLVGAASLFVVGGWVWHQGRSKVEPPPVAEAADLGALKPWVPKSPPARRQALTQLTAQGKGVERQRAKYLLAVDSLDQGDPKKALQLLQGLERDYPVLSAYVLWHQARAYQKQGNRAAAQRRWQHIVERYPDQELAAEALLALGRMEEAKQRYPAHPQVVAWVQKALEKHPHDRQLLLHVARHGLHLPNLPVYLDRLVHLYRSQLTPDEWQAIAFAYWEKEQYLKAGRAYLLAPLTVENLYRAARGHQLGGKTTEAMGYYQDLVRQFGESPQAVLALYHLSHLAPAPQRDLYFQQLQQRDSERAARVLWERLPLWEKAGQAQRVSQARTELLARYAQTQAAAQLRWELARSEQQRGNLRQAMHFAEGIWEHTPQSDLAPRAGFWLAAWAKQLGQAERAKTLYTQVIERYPDSYYAWRSAVRLGWPVGDFAGIVQTQPTVQFQRVTLQLLSGSPPLQELYRLGEYQDAWEQWQLEFTERQQPRLVDQLTDGVLRVGIGDRLEGLFLLSTLERRVQTPQDQQQYAQVQRDPAYWQALYPLAYWSEVQQASAQHGLNPLLVTALIRQESRFEPAIVSSAGAVGLMQVLPETGAWIAEQLQRSPFQLTQPWENLLAGTWFLQYTDSLYQHNGLLAVASYNAGPGNVDAWVQRFGEGDWDEFVENIPFPETQDYVRQVFGNYWNYLRLYDPAVCQRVNPHLCVS